MNLLGYSERGIVNSLFYGIFHSPQPEQLLEMLLCSVRFPYLDGFCVSVVRAEVLLEQGFSDFGDADAVLLIDTGAMSLSIFVEAKVRTFNFTYSTIQKEFDRFTAGIVSTVDSSNLFTQLYHKARMVDVLRAEGLTAIATGVAFPACSTKLVRKIGGNSVVLEAVKKVAAHIQSSFYLAIVPDESANLETFFKDAFRQTSLSGFEHWDRTLLGYLAWSDVERFCEEHGLEDTLRVFEFNREQIYGRSATP